MFNENSNEKTLSPREKLSREKIEMRIAFEHFRGLRNQREASDRSAQMAQEKMKQELLFKKQELKEIADETNDPILIAEIETREKEIEKSLIEIEIEWLEKRIWDLHADEYSQLSIKKEKIKIQNDIIWIKRGGLLLALTDCVSTLREEKLLLEETDSTPSTSGGQEASPQAKKENLKRLSEIVQELKKLESEFEKIKDL